MSGAHPNPTFPPSFIPIIYTQNRLTFIKPTKALWVSHITTTTSKFHILTGPKRSG